MKKSLIVLMFLMGIYGMCFSGSMLREDESVYSEVLTITNTAVTVDSFTATTAADIGIDGVRRIFKINGTTTGSLYCQLGGSTTTITTNGFVLEDSVYYLEDNYFGDIYFQTDTATADLRISTIEKINS